jgi:regulator of PEP synthase PpsR (kinase-PPPase family)
MKGVGFTYGAGINPGELDNYLVKQRNQTVQYRREYANALLNNDVWKAQSLAAEYEKRFKMPLTITPQQLDRVRDNRNVSRRERIVKTFSVQERAQYGSLVGVPAAQLPDATKREVERAISKMQQVGPSATAASFQPYETY